MIKWFSRDNLEQLAAGFTGKISTFSSAVQETFDEVYENLEAIDNKVGGFSYSETEETLTVPAANGTVADETLILK